MKTIKSKKAFEQVFSGGRRANTRLVRITCMKVDPSEDGKVAFVAAKRLGNAVYRNRCKRVLREAARECGLPACGWKLILFATNKTHDSNPHEVGKALTGLLSRVGVDSLAE